MIACIEGVERSGLARNDSLRLRWPPPAGNLSGRINSGPSLRSSDLPVPPARSAEVFDHGPNPFGRTIPSSPEALQVVVTGLRSAAPQRKLVGFWSEEEGHAEHIRRWWSTLHCALLLVSNDFGHHQRNQPLNRRQDPKDASEIAAAAAARCSSRMPRCLSFGEKPNASAGDRSNDQQCRACRIGA